MPAITHLATLAERLCILNSHASNLLASLYHAYRTLNPPTDSSSSSSSFATSSVPMTSAPNSGPGVPASASSSSLAAGAAPTASPTARPNFLSDTSLQPVLKAFVKEFPDQTKVQKTQGYSNFSTRHKEVSDELRYYYQILVEVVDFTEASNTALLDAGSLITLGNDVNMAVNEQFLLLLSNSIVMHHMVSNFSDRKLVASAFCKTHMIVHGAVEPNFNRLQQYILDYDRPFAKLGDVLMPVSARVVGSLMSLRDEVSRCADMTADMIRKEGLLNLIHAPNTIKAPVIDDGKLRGLSSMNFYSAAVALGLLVCPTELVRPVAGKFEPNPATTELLKSVLGSSAYVPVYRDEVINVVAELEQIIKANDKKLSKLKNFITDVQTLTHQKCFPFHKDRRDMLRYQLKQTLSLCTDKPGLLGPKFPSISAMMGFARDETIWYFLHMHHLPAKGKGKLSKEDLADVHIAELMFLNEQMRRLVIQHQRIIQGYYTEFLANYYRKKILPVIDDLQRNGGLDEVVVRIFDSIAEKLAGLPHEQPTTVEMESFRLNWQRLQVYFSSPGCSVPLSAIAELNNIMNEIVLRSRFVDQVEAHANAQSQLRDLFYFLDVFRESFQSVILDVEGSRFSGVYPTVTKQFLNNVTEFTAGETEDIGRRSVLAAEQFYSRIAAEVARLVHETGIAFYRLATFTSTKFATGVFLESIEKREKKGKVQPTAKKTAAQAPPKPGYESVMSPQNAAVGKAVEDAKRHVVSLLYAFSPFGISNEPLHIHDAVITPRQYLIDALVAKIKGFLFSLLQPLPVQDKKDDEAETIFIRPSALCENLRSYLAGFHPVQTQIGLGLASMIRDIFLEVADSERFRKKSDSDGPMMQRMASVRRAPNKSTRFVPEQGESSVISLYTNWFVDVIAHRVANGSIIFSPTRRSFVSRPTVPLRIEEYTEVSELRALCEVIGPNGVRFFDERMLRDLSVAFGNIKEYLIANQETLVILQRGWSDATKCNELLKKLRFFDEFLSKALYAGALLEFRKLLYNALADTVSQRVPNMFQCIELAHLQYPRNMYGNPSFLPVDAIGNAAGIFSNVDLNIRGTVDVHCRNPNQDQRIWGVLPTMAAAALNVLAGMETSNYSTALDALENNGHCLATTFNVLSTVIPTFLNKGDESAVLSMQEEFVSFAATLLLRMRFEQRERADAGIIVLHKFVEDSDFMTDDRFEKYVPYALLRNAVGDSLRKQRFHQNSMVANMQTRKKQGGREEDATF